MVFREETTLEVQHMVRRMESESSRRHSMYTPDVTQNHDAVRQSTSSVEEPPTQPKLKAVTNHARSCLGSNLFHSVFKGRIKKVKFLIDNGVNVNNRNDYGYNVLVAALHIENPEKRSKMFRYLLNNDADPFEKDPKYKRTALGWTAILGRNQETKTLLESYMGEFNFHEKDKDGMTAIHLATIAGHTEVVKSLVQEMIKFGTTVDVPDNLGLTPYLHAKRLGFGLIADILREEGGASVGQGDKYTFKRAEEWRDIGIRERNEEVRKRRNTLYEQAAISGSARMLMEFEGPGYEIISVPSPRNLNRKRFRSLPRNNSSSDAEDDNQKSVRIRSPRSQISLPAGNNLRAYHHDNKHSLFDSPSEVQANGVPNPAFSPRQLDTMSLIQMREARKGIAPKPFRHSELDTKKAKEYQNVYGGLTTMLDYLTMQHCKSFRHPVPPPEEKTEDAVVGGKKGSTLAIIFGKGKKGKKSPTSPKSRGKEKGGSAKNKKGHLLKTK